VKTATALNLSTNRPMKIIASPVPSSQWDKFIPRIPEKTPPGFETIKQIAKCQGV